MVATDRETYIYKTVDKNTKDNKTHKNTRVTRPTLKTCDVQSHCQ